jgi:phosphoribosyl-AMP cyclohydrolase / phosphoribosyl-ATP pyrophosphohydrolase
MSHELRAAIIQDARTERVLMLGWMDEDALQLTRRTGEVHFFSRSRNRLWHKGETSGNVMRVEELTEDCDGDAVLVRVNPSGPACHIGAASCFAPWLWRRVLERSRTMPEGSYVARLLTEGVESCAQKVGEEGVEVALAAVASDDDRLIQEMADLIFHTTVLLAARGLDPVAVDDTLRGRAAG